MSDLFQGDSGLVRTLHSRRSFLRVGGCVAATGCLGACIGTNPATGRTSFTGLQSVADDVALGRREHPKLVAQFGGEYDNARLQSYITQLGRRAAVYAEFQEFPYTFTIVNSPIVNAFALPGGFVYVSRGLITLASNEAELMGVISHEIGHVNARHTAERIASSQAAQLGVVGLAILTGQQELAQIGGSIAGLVLQQFSQSQEHEADSLGVRYMSKAGYDPDGMASFLNALRENAMIEAQKAGLPAGKVDERNIMATHPRTIDRVRRASAEAAQAVAPGNRVGRQDYLGAIEGMLYGDDPRQGVVRDGRFVHPGLRMSYAIPKGFAVQNGASQVVAQDPASGAVLVFDMGRAAQSVDMATYLSRDWAREVRVQDLRRTTINGIQAAMGWSRVQGRGGTQIVRALALRGDGTQVFRLRFVTSPKDASRFDKTYRDVANSFSRLTPREAAEIKPYRLKVVAISPGDTVAKLSRGLPEGRFSEAIFRVLNDLAPNQRLPSSGNVKVVAT